MPIRMGADTVLSVKLHDGSLSVQSPELCERQDLTPNTCCHPWDPCMTRKSVEALREALRHPGKAEPSHGAAISGPFGPLAGSLALCAALWMLPATGAASGADMDDLARRLRQDGAEQVNLQLGAQAQLMARLNQAAADCDPPAVQLAVALSRTRDAKARELHEESLRAAVGACTDLVLSLLTPAEVPRICASVSGWTVTQTARELRRRIAQLDLEERRQVTRHGKACRAAYLHELQTTRVGLRVAPSRKAGP